MPYILVNIGCIECGVSTDIVGVFSTLETAKAHAERLRQTHHWREGGQNAFEFFAMPEIDKLNPEYL